MSTAAAQVLDALYASDEFAVTAVYQPPGGGAAVAPLRVMIDMKSETDMPDGGGFAGRRRRTVRVRVAELAEPAQAGRFITATETIEIAAAPRRHDRLGLIWACEGRVVS
jgi:hypothetical protein